MICCAQGMILVKDDELRKLVQRYLVEGECRGDGWAGYYRMLPLTKAIEQAAMATGPGGKKHRHQYRIPWAVLRRVADCLLSKQSEIEACQSFECLKEIVEECRVSGFGRVALYDTAQRIGVNLGLAPDRVYLHAGARDGARNLGMDVSRGYLMPEELPLPLQELEPDDVETFLCRYKHELVAGSRPTRSRASRSRAHC